MQDFILTYSLKTFLFLIIEKSVLDKNCMNGDM